jgi:hypothetical protein
MVMRREECSATALDAFLKAEDLDDLLRIRRDLGVLTSDEEQRISSIIHDWTDNQAVANLLFNPDVMPPALRFEALDRALHSNHVCYFALAATVGLQQVKWNEVPGAKRASWLQALQRLVRSKSRTVAGRASVTLFEWTLGDGRDDILMELLSLYPVSDEGACRNIVAIALARWHDLSAEELTERLSDGCVTGSARAAVRQAHEKHRKLKARDEFRALIMKSPAYVYIPNLWEARLDDSQSA